MGRRRRKVVRRTAKPYPTMFLCPVCHHETVTAEIHKKEKKATITCSNCDLTDEVKILPIHMPVDAYCIFYDRVVKGETSTVMKPSKTALSQESASDKGSP